MKQKDSQNQNPISNGLIDFSIEPDFLMNFRQVSQNRKFQRNLKQCPQFSAEDLQVDLGPTPPTTFPRSTSLLAAPQHPHSQDYFCSSKQNPFHDLEECRTKGREPLGGFLKNIDVSRISEDFSERNCVPFQMKKKDIIRSMDFENISFEEKSQDNFLQNNIFFDIGSFRQESPIQKSTQQLQKELQILLKKNKEMKEMSTLKKQQVPSFQCEELHKGSKSVMLIDSNRENNLNPFKEVSFTSEKDCIDINRNTLKCGSIGAHFEKKTFGMNYSVNKSSIKKNCFYETDEESDKEGATMASKMTISPSMMKGRKTAKSAFRSKLEEMGRVEKNLIPEVGMVFSPNDSFLTQNKSLMSLPQMLKSECNTIPLYRADQAAMLNANVFRSRSQRSVFSLNKEKHKPSFTKKKILGASQYFGSLMKNNSCYFPRNKKAVDSFFQRVSSKSSNFLDSTVLSSDRGLWHKTPEKRVFSPSQHSAKQVRFWPSHLEERVSQLNSSFCSGMEPFLSCLSPNSKSLKKIETNLKISKQANRIIEINKKITKDLLDRNNSFDPQKGKELVEMFTNLIHDVYGDKGQYKENSFLKKVKHF